MKKLLLLTSLFLAFSCVDEPDEDDSGIKGATFLEAYDGKGFIYSDEISDKYVFFYNSDIFLKEVEVYNPSLDTYCDSYKKGSNTDDGYNFTAEILTNAQPKLSVKISYTDDEGNTISSVYNYVDVCKTPTCSERVLVVEEDKGSEKSKKEYSETPITQSSLCNSSKGYTVLSTSSNFSFSSIAIDANGEILAGYQCEQKENGVEKSIPLAWNNVPEGTGALAISIHGFPNPNETNSYLTLWGIAPSVTSISHGGADDGDWYIGPNKDGAALSYTSPCNPNGGTTDYYITLYALNQTPASLPTESSLEIDYDKLVEAIATVTVIDSIQIAYKSVSSN